MTTQTLIWRLTILYLVTVVSLGWLALEGYTLALIVLTVLITVSLLGVGLLFGLGYLRQAGKQQQDAFLNNARENLAMMNAMQKVQNQQNQTLMQQLGAVSRLPQHGSVNDNFLIEDGVFDQLED